MPVLSYKGKKPFIGGSSFVAENSTLVGNVIIGESSSVWYGASIRAESDFVKIGNRSNIQENCVLHVDEGFPCILRDNVSVGHGAVIHGSRIGSNCLIGIGSILLNGCKIGDNCMVAAGTLILEETEIPDGSLVIGSPGTVRRKLRKEEIEKISRNADHYCEFAAEQLLQMKS